MGINGWGVSVVWVMNGWQVVQNTSKGCNFIWYNSYVHIANHYEKIDFWKFWEFIILSDFYCILKLFSLCKNKLKIWSFIFRFFRLRMLRGWTNVLRRSFWSEKTFGEHWFDLSSLSAKKIEIWKIRFLAYFYIRKIALKIQ